MAHRFTVALALALLASSALLVEAAARHPARRLLHGDDHTLALEMHLIHPTSTQNITGVWVGLGDQYSAKVWDAYFAQGTLPKCTAANTSSTWKHWSEPFPDTLAFAYSAATKSAFGINGHEDGTYVLQNVSLVNGTYLRATYEGDDEPICARFEMFVDPRDGLVYSRVIYASEWRRGVDGKVATRDVSCAVGTGAKAGCTVKDANTVLAVSVASYVCKAGVCLQYSPAFEERQ